MPGKRRRMAQGGAPKRRRTRRFRRNQKRYSTQPFKPGRLNQISFGFPKTKMVRMRYCTNEKYNLAGGRFQKQWKANGLYDPEITTGGHQPMGLDQWYLFYNHYVVVGAAISCTVSGSDSSETGSLGINMLLSDDATVPSSLSTLVEEGRGTTQMQGGFNAIGTRTVRGKYSAKKFFNIKDIKDNVTRLGSPMGADPNELAVFTITIEDPALNTTSDISILTVIDYIVLLSEPKDLAPS